MTQPADPNPNGRLLVDVHLNGDGILDTMAEDVRRGLSAPQKWLSPKYFYDDRGSDLFERITELPEYYPTRAERSLLEGIVDELMADLRPTEIVELGSGSSSKTRIFLDAATTADHLRRYIPFDVSEGIVRASAQALLDDYHYLSVHGVIGDFERHLSRVPPSSGPRLVLFLGGTIGNLDPVARTAFLSNLNGLLSQDDHLLVGVDLVKDIGTIEAAYNDSAGVTAAFNRNVLAAINRSLYANFEPDSFEHRAFFNEEESRIEMHLVAATPQTVVIPHIEMTLTLAPSETIWTESSYKFTDESIKQMLDSSGLLFERLYTNDDPDSLFGLVLARPSG